MDQSTALDNSPSLIIVFHTLCSMTPHLIHKAFDEHGEIRVYDDGMHRYLRFGEGADQGCVLKSSPAHLVYDYTKAMLLPLLFGDAPKRIVLLGLGTGSLASCLGYYCRNSKITAVELRASVVDVAHQHFGLSRRKKLEVVCQDALGFLQQQDSLKSQLILSDIYGEDDVDSSQLSEPFLDECLKHLQPQGWLVLNCWQQHRRLQTWRNALQDRFDFLAESTTKDGNWIIFARRQEPTISQQQLKRNAQQWKQQTGFSLPLERLDIWQR